MESTVKERLAEYIKYKGISVNRFEKTNGLSTGYVRNMRVSIQPDKLSSIAHNYPDLNTGWLMTGEGEMLKKETKVSESVNDPCAAERERLLSIIDSQRRTIEILSETVAKLTDK